MTQEEVIQLMRKVIKESEYYTTWTVSTPHLVELVERAVEAEREACAKVCEEVAVDSYTKIGMAHEPYMKATAEDCARHIRARGQT